MKKVLMLMVLVVTAALAAVIATGCAGPGSAVRIPLTMPDGEKATIVAHNQSVPDWMLAKAKLALNFIVKGEEVSGRQLMAVAEAERGCRIYTGTVRPSNLVAVLSNGVLYGAAGFVGVGVGSYAFTGVSSTAYAEYGAAASGAGGIANGLVTLGGQTYTFENCGREIFGIFPGYEVHILQKSPY